MRIAQWTQCCRVVNLRHSQNQDCTCMYLPYHILFTKQDILWIFIHFTNYALTLSNRKHNPNSMNAINLLPCSTVNWSNKVCQNGFNHFLAVWTVEEEEVLKKRSLQNFCKIRHYKLFGSYIHAYLYISYNWKE